MSKIKTYTGRKNLPKTAKKNSYLTEKVIQMVAKDKFQPFIHHKEKNLNEL